MKTALALVVAMLTGPAHAEVLTFKADNDVVLARCTDAMFPTVCELIFPQGTAYHSYVCVAINHAREPIATNTAPDIVFTSSVLFDGVPVGEIDDVKCRRR